MSKDFDDFKCGNLCIYVGDSNGYVALMQALKERGIEDPHFKLSALGYEDVFPYFYIKDGDLDMYAYDYTVKNLVDWEVKFLDWSAVDFVTCSVTDKAMAVLNALDPIVATEVYVLQRMQRVAADVSARAEEQDVNLTQSEVDSVSAKYVRECRYDCNLSYWDNLDVLIKEQIAERN